jgi:hypothetical protein
VDQFLHSKESPRRQCVIFAQSKGLNGAISQQNGNAIHDGVAPPTALAPYRRRLKLQGLVAHGADDPAQILCCQ